MILVFDGWAPGDDRLDVAHWMATETQTALNAARQSAQHLEGKTASRAGLETAATKQSPTGVAFFAHQRSLDAEGRPTLPPNILGADGELAFDEENAHVLAGCWVHAVACRSAPVLADAAVRRGVSLFVGYRPVLNVEWDPEALSTVLQRLVGRLVTAVTLKLAANEREKCALEREAEEAAMNVQAYIDGHPTEETGWLAAFANAMGRLYVASSE